MRVLAIGGAGVNGAWVVRSLLKHGHEVGILENRKDTSLIEDVADRVEMIQGDICDADCLTDAMVRFQPECVIHLAAVLDADGDPTTAIAVNIGGTANVCAAAAAAGAKRVVFTSTKGVYGPSVGERGFPQYEQVKEDDERRPQEMYGITKAATEDVLWWYGRNTELECVSIRFGMIFGPGKRRRHAEMTGFGQMISIYDAMIEMPASGQPFAIAQGADERNDFTYVLDVADAIVCVALAPGRLQHVAYNVTSGTSISTSEFAEAVRRVIPGADLKVGPGLNPMEMQLPHYTNLDGTRMYEEFGWKAQFDLDSAIRHDYEYLKSHSV